MADRWAPLYLDAEGARYLADVLLAHERGDKGAQELIKLLDEIAEKLEPKEPTA